MFKMLAVVFFGRPRDKEKYEHAHESPLCMLIPLVLLGFLALSSGWGGWFEELIRKPELKEYAVSSVAEVSSLAGADSGANLVREELGQSEAGHGVIVVFSLLMLAAGAALALVIYFLRRIRAEAMAQRFSRLHRLLYQKYYLDELYQLLVINPLLAFTRAIKWFDERIIDGAVNGLAFITRKAADLDGLFDNLVIDGAVNGTANIVLGSGALLRRIQTGKLQNYLTLVLIGIFLIFILSVL
jgi:NADH-quinone oxidoreductase subunit L